MLSFAPLADLPAGTPPAQPAQPSPTASMDGSMGERAQRLGVMGGGQLGRMFVHAAQQLGFRTVVLEPDLASPAGGVAHEHILAGYSDPQGLSALAQAAAAVTTEFENVPATSLDQLAAHCRVTPSWTSVAVCQDRAREKALFLQAGVPCAPHLVIETVADLQGVTADVLPGILKTSRLGYDGRGQIHVNDRAGLEAAWQELGQVPCVLEKKLALLHEISVVLARNDAGDWVHLPVGQNLHRDGILALTQSPATDVAAPLQERAIACAAQLAAQLGHVGVLCVEFFVVADTATGQPQLVANEMAPRPHNSGHHSIDSCDSSQFDLQVRVLAGLPLVQPRQHSPAVMLNLLGDIWFTPGTEPIEREPNWAQVLALPGVHLHLYGKAQARPGRKMGHLTVTATDLASAQATAAQVARHLGMAPW